MQEVFESWSPNSWHGICISVTVNKRVKVHMKDKIVLDIPFIYEVPEGNIYLLNSEAKTQPMSGAVTDFHVWDKEVTEQEIQ